MRGIIAMNNNQISGLPNPISAGSEPTTKSYVDSKLTLKLDKTITADIDMKNHKIINISDPINSTDCANKVYVDSSHLTPTGQTNVFEYLMKDSDHSSSETSHIFVDGIINFQASAHKIDKRAHRFALGASGASSYRERIGYALHPLTTGFYSIVSEFYRPSMQNISMTAAIGAGSIIKQTSTTFQPHENTAGYIKLLVQINHVRTGLGTDYIYFDMHGDITLAHDGYMVIYGVRGLTSNIPSSVFDKIYTIENGRIELQTDIDLQGHRLMDNNSGGIGLNNKKMMMYSNLDLNSKAVMDNGNKLF